MSQFESISVTEVKRDQPILDVREQDEWDAGHIENAVHIPLSELPQRISELDLDADYQVTCLRGGRSAQAVQWLAGQGYSVVNVDGGMAAWAEAGLPTVAESGEPFVKGH
jgi:rhodanese-related sulfurtransferase